MYNIGDRVRVSGLPEALTAPENGDEGTIVKTVNDPSVAVIHALNGLEGDQGLWVAIDGKHNDRTDDESYQPEERGNFAIPSGYVEAIPVAQAA